MSAEPEPTPAPGGRSLTALSLEDMARLLKQVGYAVTVAMIEQDLVAGCPTNADGTLSVVDYLAWSIRELNREA